MNTNAFSKTYQTRTVLSFPAYSFQPGTIYAVIGANGCGKSTFAKVLSGTIPSDTPAAPVLAADSFGEKIGYLPQKPYAFHMSLRKNLLINGSGSNSEKEARVGQLLEALNLTSLSGKKASTLSGGETARMALARLMMEDYSVLLLDEPCAAMDIVSTLQAEDLIKSYRDRTQAAIILITHSLAQARRIADQVLFFHQGQLMEAGETQQIMHQPDKKETREFLEFFY